MKLTNAKQQLIIEIKEGRVPVLAIENADVFLELTEDIYRQSLGEDGDIVLSEEDKILIFSKTAVMVSDYFCLDLNQRKIQNILYKNMQAAAFEFSAEKDKMTIQGIDLLDKIIGNLNFDHITYDLELDWNDIFKLFHVRIEEDYVSLTEKVISFMRLCSQLLKIRLLILVGLKSYISDEQLLHIYKMADYLKIYLLLIEPVERQALKNEDYYIIDRDKCLIIK